MPKSVIAAASLIAVLAAAPAQAKLVYVKRVTSARPTVYAADNRGKHRLRLGVGLAPAISPNGRWVAYVSVPRFTGEAQQIIVQRSTGGTQRIVARSKTFNDLRFSPDSSKVAAVAADRRIRVYDLAADRTRDVFRGHVRGFAFSPDSKRLAVGKATSGALDAPADLYVGSVNGGRFGRLTDTGDALNPVWGRREIVFDRFRPRVGDAPAFDLWATNPSSPEDDLRRITRLKLPPLVSGLVPLELSRGGRRLLASFTGQDAEVGFKVNTVTGRARALSRDFEHGVVGFDLTADGRTILGHTGGPDPSSRHDVVTVPYGGRKHRVLVEDAAYPDWNR